MKLRISARVQEYIRAGSDYQAIGKPESPDHTPWVDRLFSLPSRKDGSTLLECNEIEVIDIRMVADYMEGSAFDNASQAFGDNSDGVADLNAARGLIRQIDRLQGA